MINQDFHFEISEFIGSKHIDRLMQTVETSEAASRMHHLLEQADAVLNKSESIVKAKTSY